MASNSDGKKKKRKDKKKRQKKRQRHEQCRAFGDQMGFSLAAPLSKTITALAWTSTASRLATGDAAGQIQLWDTAVLASRAPTRSDPPSLEFDSDQPTESSTSQTTIRQSLMKEFTWPTLKPFRRLDPVEDERRIRQLDWHASNQQLLVAAAHHVRVCDREGLELLRTPKGYPFIADLAHTKGHTGEVTSAAWLSSGDMVSASLDSTVRTWKLGSGVEQQAVIKVKNAAGLRNGVTALACDGDDVVWCGALDGLLQAFDAREPRRPAHGRFGSHRGEVTAIAVRGDQQRLATRSVDKTLALFDLRKLDAPVAVVKHLASTSPRLDCAFAPDGRQLLTGTSADGGQGLLVIVDALTGSVQTRIGLSAGAVVRILPSPKPEHSIGVLVSSTAAELFFLRPPSVWPSHSDDDDGSETKRHCQQ